MSDVNEIYVYENWKNDEPSLLGTLYVDGGRGKQVISFEYTEEWLQNLNNNAILDPDLGLFKGRQYAPADKLLFGIFADSCPDRWGRLLMKRREAILAKKDVRKPKTLTDVDFLLGVYDETRMGGLRFSTIKGGSFYRMIKNWQLLLGQHFESWNLLLWHLKRTRMVWKKNG